MNTSISVLDHGIVRLIDYMGNDLSIVRNARVSYDAEWRAGEDKYSDERLLNYLYRNGHNTPFESATFTFEVKAPIFVIRQWHRHRTWSYNEISARYKELPADYYVPAPEVIGKQHSGNKQMREITKGHSHKDLIMSDAIADSCANSFAVYHRLIDSGIPRELARTVLPVSTYTHMFATVNLNNLFKFLTERQHPHAQYEIRVYADALLELIKPIVPACVAAYEANRQT